MQGCDTLLMIGSGFPYAEWLPEPGQARGVQIDLDARMLGIRYPMEVNLAGDARDTLQALLPLLQQKTDRSWPDEIAGEIERWWSLLADQAEVAAEPVNPQKVFHELSPRLPGRRASSPPTPAPAPTGTRATCASGAGCAARCQGRWPRWARRCRTRWRRSSSIPTGR